MAGSNGKEENTMPLELAIQRELEYRRMVAAFHLRPKTNFTKEVKSPNDASQPKLFPGASSMKFSTLSETKRKESPTISTHHQHLKHLKPFNESLNQEVMNGAWDLSLNIKSPNDACHHSKPLLGSMPPKVSSLSGTKQKESPTRSTHHPHLKHQQPFHGSFNHKLNVKSSNDASLPKLLPGPSSSNFSSLLEIKRKQSPTRNDNHPCLLHQQPFSGSINHEAKRDDLYCKICKISCSSPFNLKQHFKGHKHTQMLQKGLSNQMQWCEVCNISCMNEDLLKLHFQGQKHRTKLRRLEISREGGEVPNKPKRCELCKLWCSGEFAFRQHLEGKKHIIQKHAMEKEKERNKEMTIIEG